MKHHVLISVVGTDIEFPADIFRPMVGECIVDEKYGKLEVLSVIQATGSTHYDFLCDVKPIPEPLW